MTKIVPLTPERADAVEALLDAAFGPDRRRRTAYAVRGGVVAIPALGFAGVDADGTLIGSIQCWPVLFTGDAGERVAMVMVGPVAVMPGHQQGGLGRRLTETALAAADTAGLGEAMMLIGDPEYYERFFGFTADRTARWRLPGPVEPRRLLARGTAVPDGAGVLGPA
ncbi:N-acetyltransferase [Sphingomonas sp. KR1UV-12]|uniref:N-acetyltransferase n=1 Tax=Sphingomonas aurea TaxID=3063994 RepID=A0ABT9EIX9_9SPHN|nr:N-acetyltransferase [Sphingomonas sp. KR1UV-12]MDP1026758.1 N-acetyltransferase [Sphingomonas sp. KR1UV-12]